MYTRLQRNPIPGVPVLRWFTADHGAAIVQPTSPQSQRVLSVALMLTGLVIAAIAILADRIRIGTGEGFGYYQMIVLIAGIVIFLIGLAVVVGDKSKSNQNNEFHKDPE